MDGGFTKQNNVCKFDLKISDAANSGTPVNSGTNVTESYGNKTLNGENSNSLAQIRKVQHDEHSFFGSTFGKKQTKTSFLTVPTNKPGGDLHSRSAENLKTQYKFDSDDDSVLTHNVYLDVNGYKTFFAVCEDGEYSTVTRDARHIEPSYAWEYDPETLKALTKVTRKFDSFRMRQLRAKCFNESEASQEKHSNDTTGNIISMIDRCTDFNRVSYTASMLLQYKHLRPPEIVEINSNSAEIQNQSLKLSCQEIDRIDFFYSSLGSETYVAGCLVDVLASVRRNDPGTNISESSAYRWVQVWVGVPVLVLDIGNAGKRPRQLSLVIAQRDTGLPLWKERVTYATDYRQIENEGLHLLNEAGSEKRALKIRWSDWDRAEQFMEKFKHLTSNPNDPLWMQSHEKFPLGSKSNKERPKSLFKSRDLKKYRVEDWGTKCEPKSRHKRLSFVQPNSSKNITSNHNSLSRKNIKKEDISQPFNLKVLTRVESKDINFRTTFAGLLPVPQRKKPFKTLCASLQDEDFRPRLPTN